MSASGVTGTIAPRHPGAPVAAAASRSFCRPGKKWGLTGFARPAHAATVPASSARRARGRANVSCGCAGNYSVDDPGISQEVRALIVERIDSVVQLEVLLLLQANADRAWTAADVAQELRIEPSWATGQLRELAARGLFAPMPDAPATYRYAPNPPELDAAVVRLSKDYAERRVTVITLIFSKPVDKLRSFADAFRLRKDKP
jgi:hypothetical protein